MSTTSSDGGHGDDASRRDFLYIATGAFGGIGSVIAVWPLIDQMNPSSDVLALASTEVDLSPIGEGQAITVVWRGKPVFIRYRTAAEIEEARSVNVEDLRHPQTDEERVQQDKWLIMVGICTHLGCVPLGQKATEPHGDFGGWFCPCHGSHYDTSGRVRKGPAPENLAIPPYEFLTDTTIKIG